MKKKSRFPLFFLLFLFIASNLGNYWYFNIYCEGLYREQAEVLQAELASYHTQMYIALYDIPAGTPVSEEMVVATEGYASNTVGAFRAADIGKTAIADISAGTALSSCMVYDEAVQTGNTAQYSNIRFPSNSMAGSYVDIRIRFGNGNDYIIIPKTRLTGIIDSGNSLLTLTEQERLFLSSALVDAVDYSAEVYATVYASPETQAPAIVTYIPRIDNLPLLYSGKKLEEMKNGRMLMERQLGSGPE